MANTEVKVTIAQKFAEVMEMIPDGATLSDGTLVVDFLADRSEKSVKKSGGKSKKEVEAYEALKDTVVDVLSSLGTPTTVGALIKADKRLADYSSSKITSVLGALVKDGRVVNNKDKKTSLYSVEG